MPTIAMSADCAQRTLFLRFSTKADLLKRVVDDTFRGSVEAGPDFTTRQTQALTAATLDQRLRAFAEGVADAHARTGPMFAVAREAEASEPLIAAAFDAARRDTLANSHRMWRHLAEDGLLPPDVDIEWVANTTGLLASADTFLLLSTTIGWTRDEVAAWLHRTWTHFATTPST